MRILPRTRTAAFAHRPFQGSTIGSALYASAPGDTKIVYRNKRIFTRGLVSLGVTFPLGSTHVQKTAAIAFATSPAEPSVAIPASWHNQSVALNVRTHECDCENEQLGGGRVYKFDGSGNLVQSILGTARLTLSQKRDGGGWRFQLVYLASPDGLQPTQFVLIRTAGPTSPANVTVSYTGQRQITLDVAGLNNGGAYTFKVQAKNGSTTADLLTGLAITADSAGPPAVTGLTAVEY